MGLTLNIQAEAGKGLTQEQIQQAVRESLPASEYSGKSLILIIPDSTRTAPVGDMFKAIHATLDGVVSRLDILVALGTHQPMSEEAICERLEISIEERRSKYASVVFHNHAWEDPNALKSLGSIPASEIRELTEGRFEMDVPVEINKIIFDYDQLMILGPVFPHEVVGFSGGYKYLFPGIAGPQILNFFHWLGAVITTPDIIGTQWTPVRQVVDRAGALVEMEKRCFCMVVDGPRLAGLFFGSPEAAWEQACVVSNRLHIVYKPKPFHSILSCSPLMYDELWTGGKCMYKLEPVLAEGGELIIYAPHIKEVCVTHGHIIEEVGYHCRDFFLKQWDKYKDYPWGALAHCTHVYGGGTFEDGVETPRARVTLATGIPEEVCKKINLGYRDPASINHEEFKDREDEGILYVPKAGEMLYRLESNNN
jgi:lactate racemase